jgi:hypothetical protein
MANKLLDIGRLSRVRSGLRRLHRWIRSKRSILALSICICMTLIAVSFVPAHTSSKTALSAAQQKRLNFFKFQLKKSISSRRPIPTPNHQHIGRQKPITVLPHGSNLTSSQFLRKLYESLFKIGLPQENGCINVKTYGAKGDGVTDDQIAITNAIAAAKGSTGCVCFPPGNYLHSGVIVSDSVMLKGYGAGSVLTATSGASGAIQLQGTNCGITTIVVRYAAPIPVTYTFPDITPQACTILVRNANGFIINQCTVVNSANNAIEVFNSNNGFIRSNLVQDAASFGLQQWDCNNVGIMYNKITTSTLVAGSLALLYQNFVSNNIVVAYNQFRDTALLSGLQQSVFDYNSVQDNAGLGAGIFLLASGGIPYGTTDTLEIAGNSVDESSGGPNSFAFFMQDNGSNTLIHNVTISINSFQNATQAGVVVLNGTDISVLSNFVGNIQGDGVIVATNSDITVASNQLTNVANEGINATILSGTGGLNIAGNNLVNCCFGSPLAVNVIQVASAGPSFSALTIANNNYAGPVNNALNYIECLVPSAGNNRTISGNTTSTLLPNLIVP